MERTLRHVEIAWRCEGHIERIARCIFLTSTPLWSGWGHCSWPFSLQGCWQSGVISLWRLLLSARNLDSAYLCPLLAAKNFKLVAEWATAVSPSLASALPIAVGQYLQNPGRWNCQFSLYLWNSCKFILILSILFLFGSSSNVRPELWQKIQHIPFAMKPLAAMAVKT